MPQFISKILAALVRHRRILLVGIALVFSIFIAVIAVSYLIIEPYKKYEVPPAKPGHVRIGIVLGAGITHDGKPYKELEARLDSGAAALQAGKVDRLILSGDNRFKNYDEPTAMKNYLVKTKGIAASKLVRDYAGRSTYESCERASKIFGVKRAIIFSAGSHLPRAIYLCRHFGIEAYGTANQVEANNSTRRELLARVKAVYNIHVLGEPTVLGSPVRIK